MDAPAAEKKKILVADDDPMILRVVEMMLGRHQLTVITASNGEEAFENALKEKPDAILLDIKMPKMDGFEVCAKLKATEATAGIPVGFLTAKKEINSYKQAQKLGSILYVAKPFKPEQLISAVGLLLSSRGRAAKF